MNKAIQSLLGIEMKVEALRREAPSATPKVLADRLTDIQSLLHGEVLAMRELMQALKPIELDGSQQLPDVLASVVERFRRDSGVSARFLASGSAPSLPPATALEIVRIVQEALVNVRRHSRARNVFVRLTTTPDTCRLVVEDDGRGFEFEGEFTLAELDARRVGPAIIKERARIAGARLAIDSRPGIGARIAASYAVLREAFELRAKHTGALTLLKSTIGRSGKRWIQIGKILPPVRKTHRTPFSTSRASRHGRPRPSVRRFS